MTGTATSAKLQKQILSHSASKHQDLGYHTLLNKHVATCSTSSLESGSENLSNGGSGGLWVRKNYILEIFITKLQLFSEKLCIFFLLMKLVFRNVRQKWYFVSKIVLFFC